jgi:peptide-methionine (R)-S-oxide reductase
MSVDFRSHLMDDKTNLSEDDWKNKLTPEQYEVCREKGTEEPFTGEYWDCTVEGIYSCVCCGLELFKSQQKFDAGCGWPSFFDSIDNERITRTVDLSHNMRRIEITCSQCGSHLGHVFPDGPEPTGERYCVNSLSLTLKPKEDS